MTNQRATSVDGEAGFTLIELVVALAVIMLIAAVALPSFARLFDGPRLSEAARQATDGLREARAAAIGSFEIVRVAAGDNGRSLRFADRARILPAGTALALTGRDESGVPAIVFYPDGSANGGEVRLSSGNATRVLTVDWRTGRVADSGL